MAQRSGDMIPGPNMFWLVFGPREWDNGAFKSPFGSGWTICESGRSWNQNWTIYESGRSCNKKLDDLLKWMVVKSKSHHSKGWNLTVFLQNGLVILPDESIFGLNLLKADFCNNLYLYSVFIYLYNKFILIRRVYFSSNISGDFTGDVTSVLVTCP